MKLTYNVMAPGGKLQPVYLEREFDVHGERFFVHESPAMVREGIRDCYVVSHVRTGLKVPYGGFLMYCGTAEEAEKVGREILEKMNEVAFKAAIARTLLDYGPANEVNP